MRGMQLPLLVLLAISWTSVDAASLRASEKQRGLSEYYHVVSKETLGGPNVDAAIGNPLKGLVESPIYTNPPYKADIPLAVEFYYIGLNEIMKGNPNVVGEAAAFDWKVIDDYLSGSASRNMHAVFRVILDFPGQPLKVPKYLLDAKIEIRWHSGGPSPFYGDAKLLEALQQYITAAGKRYDGDKRLGFIQAGLLGFWGEWHTGDNKFLPASTEEKVIAWYASSFKKTKIQVRYAFPSAYAAGMGRHDDSYAFETLDGEYNGGVKKDYYTWPTIVSRNQTDFWKTGVMGGETRGHLQPEIFKPSYPANTFQQQSFFDCVRITHTTYIFNHLAFKNGGYTGDILANARRAHALMGYSFYVSTVGVSLASTGRVDVDVILSQVGVAPFYYDLGLAVACQGMTKQTISGVELLIDNGASKVFSFKGIPATKECLDKLVLSLESSYAYTNRTIKFAQGNGAIALSLPLPSGKSPVPFPIVAPTPVASPVERIIPRPPTTDAPSAAPSFAPPQPWLGRNGKLASIFRRFWRRRPE